MHELSLAQNVVDQVLAEAEARGATKVDELEIGVGELMQIDRRAFSQALKVLMAGPELEGARVRVRLEKAAFSCKRCGRRWGMAEVSKQLSQVPDGILVREPEDKALPLHFLPYLYPAFVKCPACGSSDITAESGRELTLRRLVTH